MGITITVDLGTSSPRDIAQAAKFMLLFAGFEDPYVGANGNAAGLAQVGQTPTPPITGSVLPPTPPVDDNGPIPPAAQVFGAGTPEAALASTLPPVGMQFTQSSTAAVAPAAPAAPVAPPPPGIEVDAQGVPWDQRIHSGSRAKIADGTWRQKRNLDPDVYKAVMDELRHTMGVERRAPQPPVPPAPQQVFAPVPPVPPIPAAPVVPPAPVDVTGMVEVPPPPPFAGNAAPPAPPISTTPPVPVSAGAAPAASPGSAPTFPQLMQKITAGFHAKTITQADITRAVQKVGLTALPMLAARPDLVGDVATELGVAL